MAKMKIPPFVELPNPDDTFWSEPWRVWLRDIQVRTNERPALSGDISSDNLVSVNDDDELFDTGKAYPDGIISDENYVRDYTGERYTTENLIPEAGTEEGARHGSYRIGLLTEDDYAYFDENGKLIFYGITGVQLIIPLNAKAPEKFAVFDSSGNLKYRTAEQLSEDLSDYLATKGYASETFITESGLREAGLEEGARFGNFRIGLLTEDDYAFFDKNGKLILYGIAGLQLIVPLNADTPDKFAVFDGAGNLEYRTAEQLSDDLDSYLATRDYVSETFITENLLPEAGTEPGRIPGSLGIGLGDDFLFFDEVGNLVLPKTPGKGIKVDTTIPTFGWRDLEGDVDPKATGAGKATLGVWRGGLSKVWFYDAGDTLDQLKYHIPHDYAPGSDLHIHLHWGHHGTAIAGSLVVTFGATYAKGFNRGNFPAEVSPVITVATPNIATIPQYRHRVDEIQLSAASPSGTQIDSDDIEPDGVIMMGLVITTIPTITGGVVNKPAFFEIDIHYQSTNMATKQKEPDFYV